MKGDEHSETLKEFGMGTSIIHGTKSIHHCRFDAIATIWFTKVTRPQGNVAIENTLAPKDS